jgi:hypothetical protein
MTSPLDPFPDLLLGAFWCAMLWYVSKMKLSRAWKAILWIGGILLIIASYGRAIDWFSLKYELWWPPMSIQLRHWYSLSPIITTTALSAVAGLIAAAAFGAMFWHWASQKPTKDASAQETPVAQNPIADTKANEEQIRQFNLTNRPVITLTPVKFKDDVFLHFAIDEADARGIIIDSQIGIKNVGKIPSRIISFSPTANATNKTSGL